MLRYYITDGTATAEAVLFKIQRAVNAGVELIQIRQKDWSARRLLALIASIDRKASKVLVNERMDIALAAGADGVHLPAHSPAVSRCRTIAPPGFLIAASCHSVEEVLIAEKEGADFSVLGPIFATPSKLKYGAPLGLRVLHEAAHCSVLPVFALGGVNAANQELCARAGARGVAGIRLFQDG